MQDKNNILKTLKSVKKSLEDKNYLKIKHLSNEIIHSASIEQDSEIVSLAVIIYSLSKLIEKQHFKDEKNWPSFYRSFLKNIDDMIKALEKDNTEKFHFEILSNRKLIQNLSGKLKHYIHDVFRKAKINKASKVYEHGISMEKTSKILGVSIWELAEYAGQTRIGDYSLSVTIPARQRIKLAEEIFR
ncbi:hypothetical protein GF386_06690 [Candidatus Pacearchaeota archaeon]|nr:hypothetical protein [Candidatus Pacearchaeota archaeon]MBD3283779.1 hypothetical protein [Candidatus Pacearchaeota archaeon]